jgi:hypothetical protein
MNNSLRFQMVIRILNISIDKILTPNMIISPLKQLMGKNIKNFRSCDDYTIIYKFNWSLNFTS